MMHGYANGRARDLGKSPMWESHKGPDSAYPDAWIAGEAIGVLNELAAGDQPWFFATGFFKPHLPFAAPRKWFEAHDPTGISGPPDPRRHPAPSSWHGSGEALHNYGEHRGRDPREDEGYARELRHAYAAAISFMDAQVGRVLAHLDGMSQADNTIVVFWSDHGFCLGEHGLWGKHCLYEEALKTPLIIRYPGMPRAGETSDAVVETLDIFPTLADLAGLPQPSGLDGQSLVPQLIDPDAPSGKAALAWFRNRQLSIRTDEWRLIEHRRERGEAEGYELFDFRSDQVRGERVRPRYHQDVVEDLIHKLARLPAF
jgi:iduronate 2-sulfatase